MTSKARHLKRGDRSLHDFRKAAGESENLGLVGPSANRFASSLESPGAFGAGHKRTSPSLRSRAFILARESSVAVISSAPISFLLAIALASFRSGTATMHSIAKHFLRPRLNFPTNFHPFTIAQICAPNRLFSSRAVWQKLTTRRGQSGAGRSAPRMGA